MLNENLSSNLNNEADIQSSVGRNNQNNVGTNNDFIPNDNLRNVHAI